MLTVCGCPAEESRGEWAFSKIVALGWYDGPIDGVVLCTAGDHAYRYSYIGWDMVEYRRLFVFRALMLEAFYFVVNLATKVDANPSWPLWMPRWQSRNKQLLTETSSSIQVILETESKPVALVLADSYLGRIAEIWPVTAEIESCLSGNSSDSEDSWERLLQCLNDPEGKLKKLRYDDEPAEDDEDETD